MDTYTAQDITIIVYEKITTLLCAFLCKSANMVCTNNFVELYLYSYIQKNKIIDKHTIY